MSLGPFPASRLKGWRDWYEEYDPQEAICYTTGGMLKISAPYGKALDATSDSTGLLLAADTDEMWIDIDFAYVYWIHVIGVHRGTQEGSTYRVIGDLLYEGGE